MGMLRGYFAFAVFVGVVLCGCAAQRNTASAPGPQPAFAEKIQIAGVSDAGKVNDYLYRGTQPHNEGLESLKRLGVDTIVDLRGERRGTEEKETRNAAILGIHVVNIPGNGWSPPTDEQMAQFLALVREKPRHKIYIHCWLGSDRSGVFIAAYRMAFEGWTPERALAEMYYFHFKGFWHPAMKAYVRGFPGRLAQSSALAPFRDAAARE
jgi:protein tyrosine/serine phosphatase